MRVKIQTARIRMQHRNAAGRSLKLPIVLTEGAHCLPGTAHHQIEDHALMGEGQRPEFKRHGEGQQKVFGGHLFLYLTFQPLLAFVVLAVRAVAVAAGMRHQTLMRTRRTLNLHLQA